MTNLKQMPGNTKSMQFVELGADYFPPNSKADIETRMAFVKERASEIKNPQIYGKFDSDQHYLEHLKLLMASTLEPKHKEVVFKTSILPRLKHHNNVLDVGAGSGEFTEFLGKHFLKTTIVDNSIEALNNVKDEINSIAVNKVYGSILDDNLSIFKEEIKYDFILLSHLLYYIPKDKRIELIGSLYKLLSKNGIMAIVFNSGGDRSDIIKHFGSNDSNFNDLQYEIPKLFNASILYKISEFLDGGDIESTAKIISISLHDGGIEVEQNELYQYLNECCCKDDICQVSMDQHILLLGNLGDY